MDFIKENYEWMVAALALMVSIWAAHSAHASKVEARKSREASERAAGAAERSAHADEKMAAFAEADKAAADAALARSPWEITPLGKHRVRITNTGPKAFEVKVGVDAQYLEIEGDRGESSDMETGDFLVASYTLAGDSSGAIKLEWAMSAAQDAVRLEQRDVLT